MSPSEPRGPFCQSCSMPLRTPEDFGTDSAGYRVNDYCRHCYEEGAFTDPEVTMNEMINRCTSIMANHGIMPEAGARALLNDVMPRLKRWRVPAGAFTGAGERGLSAGDDQC